MYVGSDMYDLARHITHDRLARAEQTRRISHLERLNRDRRSASRADATPGGGSWTIEWTSNGLAGGRVTLRNQVTGESRTGRHPFDWDRALSQALHGSS